MTTIYHITRIEQAAEAAKSGNYTPDAFSKDGFVHCSYSHQIPHIANCNFRGQSDLVLFEIDRSKLLCKVIDENLEGGKELYSHIYGAIPMSSVSNILKFPCSEDGTFEFPKANNV